MPNICLVCLLNKYDCVKYQLPVNAFLSDDFLLSYSSSDDSSSFPSSYSFCPSPSPPINEPNIQMKILMPVKYVKYLIQQERVQIPRPQQTPVTDMAKIGPNIRSAISRM